MRLIADPNQQRINVKYVQNQKSKILRCNMNIFINLAKTHDSYSNGYTYTLVQNRRRN